MSEENGTVDVETSEEVSTDDEVEDEASDEEDADQGHSGAPDDDAVI